MAGHVHRNIAILTLDQLMHHDQWVPDHERQRCHACSRNFATFTRRKHHCRTCGEVVCSSCLVKRSAEFPVKGLTDVKICLPCALLHSTEQGLPIRTPAVGLARPSTLRYTYTGSEDDGGLSSRSLAPDGLSRQASSMSDCDDSRRRRGLSSDRGRARSEHDRWEYPWPPAPTPVRERERLEALWSHDILDTRPEPAFDTLCAAAATAFECPIAAIGFMDSDRHWFKASVGLRQTEFPRIVTFCAHALLATRRYDDALVVLNTTIDRRFEYNPLVTGPAAIRFYASAPIWSADGHVLGTVFVMDSTPRAYCDPTTLQGIAASVGQALVARLGQSHVAPPASIYPPFKPHQRSSQRHTQPSPAPGRALASEDTSHVSAPPPVQVPADERATKNVPSSWQHPWPAPPRPADESQRLQVLYDHRFLHSHDERTDAVFDAICDAAAETYRCPMAAIGFMEANDQWLKATVGLRQNEIPRTVAFCAHALVLRPSPDASLVVLDTLRDARFALNPLVTGPASIRFYASAPVWSKEGHVLGTVFVMDRTPRQYCDDSALRMMAVEVSRLVATDRHRPVPPFQSQVVEPAVVKPPAVVIPMPAPQVLEVTPHEDVVEDLHDGDKDVARESEMESMLVDLLRRTMQTQNQLSAQHHHVSATSA